MFNIWKASLNLLSCRRHIGKREDPEDEVVSTHGQLEWVFQGDISSVK